MELNYFYVCIIFISLSAETDSTLSKRDKKKKIKSDEKSVVNYRLSKSGPTDSSVFDKSLVSENLEAKDILENYNSYLKDTQLRNFDGDVLGYVTPWNSHGYDVAKEFGSKFTLISPVWLQVIGKVLPHRDCNNLLGYSNQ